jgi:hypothetical protein
MAANSPEPFEARLTRLEATVRDLQSLIGGLQTKMDQISATLKQLEVATSAAESGHRVICPACQTPYDMLAHHYSIGLFDNLVYVKCPKCRKSLPLQSDGRGGVQAVTD